MSDRILFVDDEPAVLEGYKRILHREFHVDTALGGADGLAVIRSRGPFAVIVSDMRMPGMDGVQFLSRARKLNPDTVRMVLTGHADIGAAMEAVNEGHIFRFLTKPCDKLILARAITTALVQYRLITAEKELLENTLMGSIKVLTDVLSLVNPAAFGRSVRSARYVRHIVSKLQLDAPWRFEAAAMLSQLGCVTLDPETIEFAYAGRLLTPEEQARLDMHSQVAKGLLSNIPRLEAIAWMIGQQQPVPPDNLSTNISSPGEVIVLGAKILKLALAFDSLKMKGYTQREILNRLHDTGEFDRELVEILADFESGHERMETKTVAVSNLVPGMILQQEVRAKSGLLLAAKGQEVSYPLSIRLNSFLHRDAIAETVNVLVAHSEAKALGAKADAKAAHSR